MRSYPLYGMIMCVPFAELWGHTDSRFSSWFKSGCREVHMWPSTWLRTSSDFNPFGMSCFASSAVTARWLPIIPMTEWKIAIAQKSSGYLELPWDLSKAVKSQNLKTVRFVLFVRSLLSANFETINCLVENCVLGYLSTSLISAYDCVYLWSLKTCNIWCYAALLAALLAVATSIMIIMLKNLIWRAATRNKNYSIFCMAGVAELSHQRWMIVL